MKDIDNDKYLSPGRKDGDIRKAGQETHILPYTFLYCFNFYDFHALLV